MRTLLSIFIGLLATTTLSTWAAAPEGNSALYSVSASSKDSSSEKIVSAAEMHRIKEAARNSDTFVTTAAQDGLLEVEAGKLAESKASNSRVKDFGRHMVTDHQQANTELEQIAKNKGIVLPTKLDSEHQSMLDQLESKSGEDFDTAYTQAMRKNHQKAVMLFKDASTASGVDNELQAFAKKTLPTLEEHRTMAMQLQPGSSSSQTRSSGG
jgi:putative membrane protein